MVKREHMWIGLLEGIPSKEAEMLYQLKPILSPTVPKGKERLRFCLHSYNIKEEIAEVLRLLATFVKRIDNFY
mgnify:CR=1 FL=1